MSTSQIKVPAQAQQLTTKLQSLVSQLQDKNYESFSQTLAEVKLLDPDNADVFHLEGLYAMQAESDFEKAHELVSQALERAPDSTAMTHNLATIKINRGQFADAERLLIKAVQAKPDYAEAFHTLAGIRKYKSGDPIVTMMENLARSGKFSRTDGSFLCFALAKAYDCDAIRPQTLDQLSAAIKTGLAADGPVIIEVRPAIVKD